MSQQKEQWLTRERERYESTKGAVVNKRERERDESTKGALVNKRVRET